MGSISLVANANAALATLDGTGFGRFTITTAAGSWEGSYQGKFAGALFADKVVAHGSGGLDGLKLKGSFAETGPFTETYMLTAEILIPAGSAFARTLPEQAVPVLGSRVSL